MTLLSTPYRFVPASEKVYAPDWGIFADGNDEDRGPHDVPFSDGVSGSIMLEIETKSPLFVGADKVENERGQSLKKRFEVDGNPAIPGASVKGALRSVVEAASFGNLRDRIDERRLSIRDLHNKADYLKHMTDMFRPLSKAGWLRREDDGGWTIEPCEWSLVKQDDLEDFADRAGQKVKIGRNRDSAVKKYNAWRLPLELDFTPGPLASEDSFAKGRVLSRASNVGSGTTLGTVIFTGQPSARPQLNRDGKDVAKKTEFLFHSPLSERIEVSPEQRRDFEFIHRDPNTGKPNEEWEFWQSSLNGSGRVPVFWLEDEKSQNGLRAFGLSMMFRLPYQHSIHEAMPQTFSRELKENGAPYDLADLIFGAVSEYKGRSLKGRANFTLFEVQERYTLEQETKEILLAPKPGFYPAYVRQQKMLRGSNPPKVPERWVESDDGKSRRAKDYTTYSSPNARLRGFKRYPVGAPKTQHNVPAQNGNRRDENSKVAVRMQPVAPGARFRGTLRVFNLRQVELGALIWALHWGDREQHAHRIGGGKPLNWGACTIRVIAEESTLLANKEWSENSGADAEQMLKDAQQAFIAHMDQVSASLGHGPSWERSEQVAELLATADMARGRAMAEEGLLEGMNDPNRFVDAKKEGLVLPIPSTDDRLEANAKVMETPPRPGGGGGHRGGRGQAPPPKPSGPFRSGQKVTWVEEACEVVVVTDESNGMVEIEIDGDQFEVPASQLKR